jgi:peptide-methionine (S)-S-oxide reductase
MRKSFHILTLALASAAALALLQPRAQGRTLPEPAYQADGSGPQTIVLAGGCFWGIEAVFEHVKGVSEAVSGYAGGDAASADYQTVSTGKTGHAESVRITYDPAQIGAGDLLKIFFSVATDPTELNYQGPDHGPQYRSEIFFTTPEQEKTARDYIAQLDQAGAFAKPVVTKVSPLKAFYPAEAYHQDYAARHPDSPYIRTFDAPKLAALQSELPQFYVAKK